MGLVDQRSDLGLRVERVADADVLDPRLEPGQEIVGDGGVQQQPRGRGAAFAVERVDHEDRGIERAVEIGIVKDHHRVLAAEFEMHPFERVGPLFHDHRAGFGFADKGDGLDFRMLGKGAARVFAKAVDEVPDTRRQARLFRDLDEDAGGDRRKLGRFVDHGAARSEGGGDFPCREHEGRVPRGDDAHGADGHTGGDVHQRGRGQALAVAGGGRAVGEKAEILGPAQGGLLHEAQRLAGVETLGKGDFLGAGPRWASAMRWRIFLRSVPVMSRQPGKAACAASAAASISVASDRATEQRNPSSTGE